MRTNTRWLPALLALAAAAPGAGAQEPGGEEAAAGAAQDDPAAEVATVLEEYDDAMKAFSEASQAAKTEEEQEKAFSELYPHPSKYAPRLVAIAKAHPAHAAALEAASWVAENAYGTKEQAEALELLVAHHAAAPEMADVSSSLRYVRTDEARKVLRKVIEANEHAAARASATYTLALHLAAEADQVRQLRAASEEVLTRQASFFGEDKLNALMDKDPDLVAQEAEQLLCKVIEDYAAVADGRYAKDAEGDLFALRNLALGKRAPEIEGKDLDGIPFKLSDYRGRVVVLDFWGHW